MRARVCGSSDLWEGTRMSPTTLNVIVYSDVICYYSMNFVCGQFLLIGTFSSWTVLVLPAASLRCPWVHLPLIILSSLFGHYPFFSLLFSWLLAFWVKPISPVCTAFNTISSPVFMLARWCSSPMPYLACEGWEGRLLYLHVLVNLSLQS